MSGSRPNASHTMHHYHHPSLSPSSSPSSSSSSSSLNQNRSRILATAPAAAAAPTLVKNEDARKEQRKEAFSKCILSQYRFCTGGVISGASYSVVRKVAGRGPIGPVPMLGGGFVGTFGDFLYGYMVECAHLRGPPPSEVMDGEGK